MMSPGLLRRFRFWMGIFIFGLIFSGVTAFPIQTELDAFLALHLSLPSALFTWLHIVDRALRQTNSTYPFLAYGTDWLAFGHLVIAIAFMGAWRNPVQNRWLVTVGLIACAAVVPTALIAGAVRGIPLSWSCIDIAFGVLGAIPLLICRNLLHQMEALQSTPSR